MSDRASSNRVRIWVDVDEVWPHFEIDADPSCEKWGGKAFEIDADLLARYKTAAKVAGELRWEIIKTLDLYKAFDV